jgi:hypothetical protein
MPSADARPAPEGPPRRLASSAVRLLTDEVGGALGEIAEYLESIRLHGFTAASRNIVGRDISGDPLALIASVSAELTGGVSGTPQLLLDKVLQEVLLLVAGLDYDLDELDPDRKARRFFQQKNRHVMDLATSLLELYVSDAVSLAVGDDDWPPGWDRASVQERRALLDAVSRQVVGTVLLDLSAKGNVFGQVTNRSNGRKIMGRLRELLVAVELPERSKAGKAR